MSPFELHSLDTEGLNILCSQLAEQYGNDVASEVMSRSRSNLQLDSMPTMPYSGGNAAPSGGKYDQLANR